MAIEIKHQGHIFTYRHPIGWTGGNESVCKKLNEFLPAGDYPEREAEQIAVKHALAGILAGGEVIAPESVRHRFLGGENSTEDDDALTDESAHDPDRILEETQEFDLFGEPIGFPNELLEDSAASFRGSLHRLPWWHAAHCQAAQSRVHRDGR